jgi:hypothetical protein
LDGRGVEVRDMRDAEMTLAIIRERGRQLPYGHPCRETDTDTSDSGPGRLDIDHWRAGCGESRTSGCVSRKGRCAQREPGPPGEEPRPRSLDGRQEGDRMT